MCPPNTQHWIGTCQTRLRRTADCRRGRRHSNQSLPMGADSPSCRPSPTRSLLASETLGPRETRLLRLAGFPKRCMPPRMSIPRAEGKRLSNPLAPIHRHPTRPYKNQPYFSWDIYHSVSFRRFRNFILVCAPSAPLRDMGLCRETRELPSLSRIRNCRVQMDLTRPYTKSNQRGANAANHA